jgi:hypothetical protein
MELECRRETLEESVFSEAFILSIQQIIQTLNKERKQIKGELRTLIRKGSGNSTEVVDRFLKHLYIYGDRFAIPEVYQRFDFLRYSSYDLRFIVCSVLCILAFVLMACSHYFHINYLYLVCYSAIAYLLSELFERTVLFDEASIVFSTDVMSQRDMRERYWKENKKQKHRLFHRKPFTLLAFALTRPANLFRLLIPVFFIIIYVMLLLKNFSWIVLVPPFINQWWFHLLEIKYRANPPFAFILGGSNERTVILERRLRKLHYPKRVVSLLRRDSTFLEKSDIRFRSDNYRSFPAWWVSFWWFPVVKLLGASTNHVYIDFREKASNERIKELQYFIDEGLRYMNFEGKEGLEIEEYFKHHQDKGYGHLFKDESI